MAPKILTADSSTPTGLAWRSNAPPLRNLFPNPSFESHYGMAHFLSNEYRDPHMTSLAGWRVYGNASLSVVDDPDFHGGKCIQMTFNADGADFRAWAPYPVMPWNPYATAVTQAVKASQNMTVATAHGDGAGITAGYVGMPVSAGVLTRIMSANTNNSNRREFGVGVSSSVSAGQWVRIGPMLWNHGNYSPGPGAPNYFYDGDSVDPDFSFAWTGAAGASSSTMAAQRFPEIPHPYAGFFSSQWAARGAGSLRILAKSYPVPIPVALVAGRTYTAMATARHVNANSGSFLYAGDMELRYNSVGQGRFPDTPGVYPQRIVFTAVDGAKLTLGGAGIGDIWWDNLLVVEGDYSGEYFDGDSPDDALYDYRWDGLPHSSTSARYEK